MFFHSQLAPTERSADCVCVLKGNKKGYEFSTYWVLEKCYGRAVNEIESSNKVMIKSSKFAVFNIFHVRGLKMKAKNVLEAERWITSLDDSTHYLILPSYSFLAAFLNSKLRNWNFTNLMPIDFLTKR